MAYNGLLGTGNPKPSLAQALAQTGPQFQQAPQATNIDPAMFGATGAEGGANPLDAPGTSVSIWRELMRGLSSQGIGALAPSNAGTVFSAANRAQLAPAYQDSKKRK